MINHRTTANAFGDAVAGMVGTHTVADVLAQLLSDCAELVSAETVAILVSDRTGRLSLLSSSSHREPDLEMLRLLSAAGPCAEAIDTGVRTAVVGDELEHWGESGRSVVAAGYRSVETYVLRWRGQLLGGMVVLRAAAVVPDEESAALSQAFADVATLVVVQSTAVPNDQVAARVNEAVMARDKVEQAKGVLAQLHGLDMSGAYDLLRQLATGSGQTLSETALEVVRRQYEPDL